MQAIPSNHKSIRGQVLVLSVVALSICSTLMLGLFQVSSAICEKIHLQLSADMAVLSALNCQANALNTIALANRAILANDAMAGQLNALVSETAFYRKLVQKFSKLLRFIPYAGVFSGFISTGINSVERILRRFTSFSLPMANNLNLVIRKGQETVRFLLPAYSLRAARLSLKKNKVSARMNLPSEAMILNQTRLLQRSIGDTGSGTTRQLKYGTMDRHTLKRNWRVKMAGVSPIRKTGSTVIRQTDLVASDKLRLKVFKRLRWRWKTVISSASKTSDFNYRTPSAFLTLEPDTSPFSRSFSILVQADMPVFNSYSPFTNRKLTAVSAGRLVYKRNTREDEPPNLFNPFWKAELIPVAEEANSKKMVPKMILREVRH